MEIMKASGSISHSRSDETVEAKARWFQSLSLWGIIAIAMWWRRAESATIEKALQLLRNGFASSIESGFLTRQAFRSGNHISNVCE